MSLHSDTATDTRKGDSSTSCSLAARREAHPRPDWESLDKSLVDYWRKRFDALMVESILPKVEAVRGSIIAEEAARFVENEVLACEDKPKRDAGIYVYERFPFGVRAGRLLPAIDRACQ